MSEDVSLSSFVEQTYLPSLRRSQNDDGGWGFNPGFESRVEPSAWALLALQEFGSPVGADEAVDRGMRFLAGAQLEDGSWAASAGQPEGCWVTSLACWALRSRADYSPNLAKGFHWLYADRPRDSTFWWRLVRRLTGRKRLSSQSASLSGWSWTPHTASWVEPTCFALIAQHVYSTAQMPAARKRCELAEAMLFDRMCPGGGWNCGNPMVYGVAGQPQVGPTVWALIALRAHSHRDENRASLDWLENNQASVRSPESLALTQIALNVYGKCNAALTERMNRVQDLAEVPMSTQAASWAALSVSQASRWLSAAPNQTS